MQSFGPALNKWFAWFPVNNNKSNKKAPQANKSPSYYCAGHPVATVTEPLHTIYTRQDESQGKRKEKNEILLFRPCFIEI